VRTLVAIVQKDYAQRDDVDVYFVMMSDFIFMIVLVNSGECVGEGDKR
jgi:hypothetical protein